MAENEQNVNNATAHVPYEDIAHQGVGSFWSSTLLSAVGVLNRILDQVRPSLLLVTIESGITATRNQLAALSGALVGGQYHVNVGNTYSTYVDGSITVGNTTTAVIAANTDRVYALIVNDSAEEIYLAFGESAVMNTGVRINPNGGAYEMSAAFGNLYTGAINGICATGGMIACTVEGDNAN